MVDPRGRELRNPPRGGRARSPARWARWGPAALALACWLAAVPCAAQSGDGGDGAVEDAAPPRPVSLDALLKLPPGTPAKEEPRPGGASRSEWTERFRVARGDLAAAEEKLAAAQAELEQLAGSSESWQVAAPGAPAGTESGPLSYGLRQEIRRQREEVERARRNLEELRVEANLAGVPEAWSSEPAAGVASPPSR